LGKREEKLMLTLIVAILLIAGGVLWALLASFAASMASRQVDTWNEVVKPCAWGLVPIALGFALMVWG
jgi:hypothetical protein